VRAFVDQLRYRINIDSLHRESSPLLEQNGIGRAYLTTAAPLIFDPFDRNRGTGSFILIDEITRETAGAGVIVRGRDAASLAADPRRRVATRGAIVWFTGLPASGKTTIATEVAERLMASGIEVEHLDGDEFRKTFSRDLGFTADDRTKNIERASQVAGLLARHRVIVLATFVSPARSHRAIVKGAAPDVLEVFVNAPLEVCMARDPKGMYREAQAGGRPFFTGVGETYEPPEHPDLDLRTDRMSEDEAVNAVLRLLTDRGIVL
jgi:bifunctional enzyme CysN/CysC